MNIPDLAHPALSHIIPPYSPSSLPNHPHPLLSLLIPPYSSSSHLIPLYISSCPTHPSSSLPIPPHTSLSPPHPSPFFIISPYSSSSLPIPLYPSSSLLIPLHKHVCCWYMTVNRFFQNVGPLMSISILSQGSYSVKHQITPPPSQFISNILLDKLFMLIKITYLCSHKSILTTYNFL